VTVWEWVTAILRRWPVLVVGLLCTVCAVWAVHKRPISYQSCGSVLVSGPTSSNGANVYGNPQASLIVATGLITTELQSPTVRQRLVADGVAGNYQAQMHNTGTSETPAYGEPEMDVCATARDPETSLRTSHAVLAEFGALLRAREVAAHVAPKYFLTSSILAYPDAVSLTGRSSQAYFGVGLIGLIATLASALWIDLYLRRRRQKRKAREYAMHTAAAPTGYTPGVSLVSPARGLSTLAQSWRAGGSSVITAEYAPARRARVR
jgi:hypothetical protein